MSEMKDSYAIRETAEGLAALVRQMEPREATTVCSQAVAFISQALRRTTRADVLRELSSGLLAIAEVMEPKDACGACAQVAIILNQILIQTAEFSGRRTLTDSLSALLKAAATPRALDQAVRSQVDQHLVDLLKQPLMVGVSRRLILDQLEKRHGRRFADHWEFIRFAEENSLGLDCTSLPRRS
jgi:hypothetical protein